MSGTDAERKVDTSVPTQEYLEQLVTKARKTVERNRRRRKPRATFARIAVREYRVEDWGPGGWIRIAIGKPRKADPLGSKCPLEVEDSRGRYRCVWLHGKDHFDAIASAIKIAKIELEAIHGIRGVRLDLDGYSLNQYALTHPDEWPRDSDT